MLLLLFNSEAYAYRNALNKQNFGQQQDRIYDGGPIRLNPGKFLLPGDIATLKQQMFVGMLCG